MKLKTLIELSRTDRDCCSGVKSGLNFCEECLKKNAIKDIKELKNSKEDYVQLPTGYKIGLYSPVEKEAVKQGFDKGVLGMLKVSGPREKSLMKKMMLETKKGKQDPSYLGRATDVIGESVQDRLKYVFDVNEDAGKEVRKQDIMMLSNRIMT